MGSSGDDPMNTSTASSAASIEFRSLNGMRMNRTLNASAGLMMQEEIASVESVNSVELFVVIGLMTLLCVIGTAGNALVLGVFSSKKDMLVSTVFIIGLAMVDFTTCLVIIPYTIFMEYTDFHVSSDLVCKVYQFLITSNIPFSALIMVAIALDRYLCICHPFWHLMTVRRAKGLIAALGTIAAGLGLCVALMHGVYQRREPSNHTSFEGTSNTSSFPFASMEVVNTTSWNETLEWINIGKCEQNDWIMSKEFQWYYQKLYTAMYPMCLAVVVVLYVLIYRSVLVRRTKRQKQKSASLAQVRTIQVQTTDDTDGCCSKTLRTDADETVTMLNSANKKSEKKTQLPKQQQQSPPRRTSKVVDSTMLANLKTAAMLFVVTVVFVITFLPAFLMALQLVPYNTIIFYLYLANNVANPVIYSFMNRNFRADLTKLLCQMKH